MLIIFVYLSASHTWGTVYNHLLTAKNMQIILGPYICIGNTKLRENVGNSRNKNPTVECFGL